MIIIIIDNKYNNTNFNSLDEYVDRTEFTMNLI